MVKRSLLALSALGCASAFMGERLPYRPPSCSTTLRMGGGTGYATTLTGKKEKVERLKGLLDTSEMIFTVPAGSLSVSQTETLRRVIPESTTAAVVKNTLMTRAVDGTEYECTTSLLKGSNMWFFIEEDVSGTLKAYNAFLKEEGLQETHGIIGGSLEGEVYDGKGVQAIGKLPSKQELYAKIAGSIKAVPTKVAQVIKAPNSKLARAIKLAAETKE